ncbi:MAG TPA: NDP-sugar synthase [Solirubrobacterales bacterium]
MQAIVLVGGEGTRLRPLTASVPKPALNLVDRPFLAYMVEWLAEHGVDEVVLACGFLPDVLREALGDDERHGARVRYVTEPEPLGTAGAIRFAADALGEDLEDRFLALNGDVLTDLDLSALLAAHERRGALATIALHPVDDAAAYGLVHRDAGGDVDAFLEKTGEHAPGEVNAGMYVLERSVLEAIAPREKVSIERDVFPQLVGNGLHSFPLDGYWMDIGTPERYLRASWDILDGAVATRVEATGPGTYVAADAEVDDAVELGPHAVIGERCSVAEGATVRDSVLFDGVRIGAGAILSGSILDSGVEVAPGARVEGAVVGRDERVPA